MRLLDTKVAESKVPKKFIEQFLSPLLPEYDYIFVDCPPGLTAANESLLHCVSLVLVPVIPTVLSVRTLEQLRDYLKESIPNPPKLKAFFTLMDARRNLHKAIFEQLCVKRKTVIFPIAIPYASIAEKMSLRKAPLVTFAASTKAGLAYQELWAAINRMRL
jgi:cellulose biosynthesis protein BcsQ